MHIMHLIAVEADNEEEAIEDVESALEPYGNGHVWDWYEVGGRWEDYFGEDKNALNYTENPKLFVHSLNIARDSQIIEFKTNLYKLSGKKISKEDINDSHWGIPIKDKAGAAKRETETNKKYHSILKELIKTEAIAEDGIDSGMLGYYLCAVGNALKGEYEFYSYLYDSVERCSQIKGILERCEGEDANRQWIVAVDLHN